MAQLEITDFIIKRLISLTIGTRQKVQCISLVITHAILFEILFNLVRM
jgi:hypothetical protein